MTWSVPRKLLGSYIDVCLCHDLFGSLTPVIVEGYGIIFVLTYLFLDSDIY